MANISVNSLTFCYDGSYDSIFEDVSLNIDSSWKLGFIGRNGRGKTTFLKLLSGALESHGSISAPVEFEYFPYTVDVEGETPLDLALRMGGEEWRLRRELFLLEVEEEVMYRPFSTLSGGERTKAQLAALFLREGGFLLIDEPTNHLDMNACAVLARYLRAKRGFILVSHDRELLDGCVDHVLSINRADIELQKGNFSSWRENRDRQDNFELAENERLRGDIARLEKAARQAADWSDSVERTKHGQRVAGLRPDRGHIGRMAAKMMKRSKSTERRRESAVEEKSRLLKNIEQADELFFQPLEYHTEILAEANDICVNYGEKTVLERFSLTLRRGERVALHGRNGCGKSTVLGLFAGEELPHTGVVRMGSGMVVSYVPQDSSALAGGLAQYAQQCEIDLSLFLAILRKLDFTRTQFEKDMRELSEGQRKKVLLARSLCQRAHLYIWDEPLNYVDIISRMQIERAIADSKPSMLFVEHDAAFEKSVATAILDM